MGWFIAYLGVGFVICIVANFIKAARSGLGIDGEELVAVMLLWPVVTVVKILAWVFSGAEEAGTVYRDYRIKKKRRN